MEETKIKNFLLQLKVEADIIKDCKLVEHLVENGMDCEALENMKAVQVETFFKKCSVPNNIQVAFEQELEAWQKENGIKPIMEKRIELEKRGRPADQIIDLNLDNCRSTSIVGLSDEYTALESLSLINVGLTTLKGFPNLPSLKKLELSDNRISNGLNHLTTSPKLTYLNLSGNKIKDLETLKPLESFQNLEVLDLFNNEATNVENYREKIFAMLPSLKYLDGFDLNEVEASSDGDDDEEVNGNDSDDDDNMHFFVNGLEIDLEELDKFEQVLRSKKSERFNCDKKHINEDDDLDEYLKNLKIHENDDDKLLSEKPLSSCCNATNAVVGDANLENNTEIIKPLSNNDQQTTTTTTITSIPLLMCGFMAILSLINFSCFSDEIGDDEDEVEYDEDEDDDDSESEEEDNGHVSLAEVYNDNIEEDNSDWGEENEAEDDEDEASDENEEGDEAANQKEAETPDDAQARGKKRKHDG